MKIFHYRNSFDQFRAEITGSIGFVPTMGALHAGHMELVKKAKSINDQCFVSIFINPRQFNSAEDLKKYPRTMESDLNLLEKVGADMVFIPETDDFYDESVTIDLDIHPLDQVFEGKFRPGHFQGVVDVLYRFFSIVQPNDIYMGLKDLQQCMVVEKLISKYFPQIKQHNCETLRAESGLALSSRNARLSVQGKLKAAGIYRELQYLAEHATAFETFVHHALRNLRTLGIETEYLSLIALPEMKKIIDFELEQRKAIVFAGYLEGVRLIDNLTITNP